MTIHRIGDYIAFSCDCCPESYETEHRDFELAWDEAEGAGWAAHRSSGRVIVNRESSARANPRSIRHAKPEFLHYCPECERNT